MTKRFSISDLRVVDSDEDSDDLPSVTEYPTSASAPPRGSSAQRSHRRSERTSQRNNSSTAGGEEMYLRSGEEPVPAEASSQHMPSSKPGSVVGRPASTAPTSSIANIASSRDEDPSSFAIAVHEDSTERQATAAPSVPTVLVASSGGDMMEGRRRRSGSGDRAASREASFVVVDSNCSTLGSRVASTLGPAGELSATTAEPTEPRLDTEVCARVRNSDVQRAAAGAPDNRDAQGGTGSTVLTGMVAQRHAPEAVADDATDVSSVSQFRSGSMSPPIRMQGARRHMDPREGVLPVHQATWGGPHNEDIDSDNESVQFVELTSNGEPRELSQGVKPCAVVLDDGREVTPDSYASNSGDDNYAETSRPDMPLLVIPEDALRVDGRMPTTNRGESLTSRLTARSSSTTGMSLYRQRLLERQQAEERQRKEELERQWQELTFQPQVGQHQPMGYSIDMVNAQPYYQRLYAEAAKKRERRKSTSRQSVDRIERKPKLNERTVEMAGYRCGDIFERLYPGKLKKAAPTPTPVCGTREVFARLTKAAPRDAGRQPHFKEEVYPFTPEITDHAKQLGHGANIVERLYKPKKQTPRPTPRGGAASLKESSASA